MFDNSMLANMPPKVVYNGKVISSIDSLAHTSTLSDPLLDMVPFLKNRSRHTHMLAHMKRVETAALKDQPTALRLLVLKSQANGEGKIQNGAEAVGSEQCIERTEQLSIISPELPASQGFRCNDA